MKKQTMNSFKRHTLLLCLWVCMPTHAMESKQPSERKLSTVPYVPLPEEKKKKPCLRWPCEGVTCAKIGAACTLLSLVGMVIAIPKIISNDPLSCPRNPVDGKWCFTFGIQNDNCTDYNENQIKTTCATNTTSSLSGIIPMALDYESTICAGATNCFLYLLEYVDCSQSAPTTTCESMGLQAAQAQQYKKGKSLRTKFKVHTHKKPYR